MPRSHQLEDEVTLKVCHQDQRAQLLVLGGQRLRRHLPPQWSCRARPLQWAQLHLQPLLHSQRRSRCLLQPACWLPPRPSRMPQPPHRSLSPEASLHLQPPSQKVVLQRSDFRRQSQLCLQHQQERVRSFHRHLQHSHWHLQHHRQKVVPQRQHQCQPPNLCQSQRGKWHQRPTCLKNL